MNDPENYHQFYYKVMSAFIKLSSGCRYLLQLMPTLFKTQISIISDKSSFTWGMSAYDVQLKGEGRVLKGAKCLDLDNFRHRYLETLFYDRHHS